MSSQTINFKQGICKTQNDEPVSPIASTETIYRGSEKLSDILDKKLSVTITNDEELNVGIDTDSIIDKINEVESIIGETDNSGGDETTGTIFAKLNKIINDLKELTGIDLNIDGLGQTTDSGATNNSGTVFGKLNKLITDSTKISSSVNAINTNVTQLPTKIDEVSSKLEEIISGFNSDELESIKSSLGLTNDSNATNITGSIFGKLNKILSDYTTARAAAIDEIKNFVKSSSSANSNGTIHEKLNYLIQNNSLIKSIQSGTFNINTTLTSSSGSSVRRYDASYSPVNLEKSISFLSGFSFVYRENGEINLTTIVSANPIIESFSEDELTILAPTVVSNNKGDKIFSSGTWFVVEFN